MYTITCLLLKRNFSFSSFVDICTACFAKTIPMWYKSIWPSSATFRRSMTQSYSTTWTASGSSLIFTPFLGCWPCFHTYFHFIIFFICGTRLVNISFMLPLYVCCLSSWFGERGKKMHTVLFALLGHMSATLGCPSWAFFCLIARWYGPHTPNKWLVNHLNVISISIKII